VNKFSLLKRPTFAFLLCIAAVIVSYGETTFTSRASFDGTDGANPQSSLTQGIDGNFYGTTRFGGLPEAICGGGCGTAFRLTPEGTLTVLHNFCSLASCADGANPGGLVPSSNGNIYGTTEGGGTGKHCTITAGCGTVFSITPAGKVTTIYSFCSQADCSDGYVGWTVPGLIRATNGNFYGTTYGGGANGYGTAFEITPTGKLTTLYSFCSETHCADGSYPLAALVQGSDGNFYGTTNGGGGGTYCTIASLLCGTVFRITSAGKLTAIYNFCNLQNCSDGTTPYGALAQGRDGNFYGTTYSGGANSSCPLNCGTVFKITPGGKLTTLYSFCPQTGCADGFGPWAGLSLGTDGNFYGTTGYGGNSDGGASGNGIIFKVTPAGALTVLYSFDNTDGSGPFAQLVQATNGTLYGTTTYGGDLSCSSPNGCGTIFNLSVGLNPFVETNPASGREGTKVGILGQGFNSSSVVKFGGTKATTVVRSGTTFISATVPAGALTGVVTVTNGTTTLTSAETFKVLTTITSFTPESGPVGTSVTVTGTGLKQTTKVTFDSKVASFMVNSDTKVTVDVPAGAMTGKIAVTTKGGSATSTMGFTVD
jgi:uncharacterized repeat protein (TIGR03803 family)